MVRDAAYETRLRNVKQTEYEILNAIMNTEAINEMIDERLLACIPRPNSKGGQVCLRRVRKAKANLSRVFKGMADKRVKFLPPGHIDYEGDK